MVPHAHLLGGDDSLLDLPAVNHRCENRCRHHSLLCCRLTAELALRHRQPDQRTGHRVGPGRLPDGAFCRPFHAGLAADGLDGAKHTDSHVPQRDLLPLHQPADGRMGSRPSAGNPIDRMVCGLYDDSRQHGRLHTADLPVETVNSPTGGPADGSGATAEKPDLTPNEEDPSCTPTFFQRSPSRA
jgi:hypothetical protein